MELSHLFSSVDVGNMRLKNRIVLLPTALGYAEGGKPGPRLLTFLEERARGGAGILETPCNVFPCSESHEGTVLLDASHRGHIPGFRELTDRIHEHGAKVAGQLITLAAWRRDENSPYEICYPSLTALRRKRDLPVREMTIEDMQIFVRQHAEAACNLRAAGFDAVEIMGGVGGIISRFMSPLSNLRTDGYGGNFENRMRLPLELISAIQKHAGEDFPILWRYSGHEFMEGGYDIDGAIEIGRTLEGAGIKWLNIQVGWHDSTIPIATKEVPQGHWAYLAARIKKAVHIPVVTAYRITDPVMAERIIAEGKADLVGMARAFFADPEWAKKAREGRFREINRCICCCRCLDQVVGERRPLEVCSVNPQMGPELEIPLAPAKHKKKILVVGGGVAGMEAARVAALRGHRVALWEQGPRLGGLIEYAALPPHKGELTYLADYLAEQIRQRGVGISLNRRATTDAVIAENSDAVIVATGSRPIVPAIPGGEGPNVVDALHVLSGKSKTGGNCVVIGGGRIGCETAELLLEQGRKVTIIEMLPKIGKDIGASERFVTISLLRRGGAILETGARVVRITAAGVQAVREGEALFFPAESVVMAVGMEAEDGLAMALRGKVPELYTVGDCVEPTRIGDAVKAAYRCAIRV